MTFASHFPTFFQFFPTFFIALPFTLFIPPFLFDTFSAYFIGVFTSSVIFD